MAFFKFMKLVIVESPHKSITIGRYLGDGYKVVASQGHIRDLSIRTFDRLIGGKDLQSGTGQDDAPAQIMEGAVQILVGDGVLHAGQVLDKGLIFC